MNESSELVKRPANGVLVAEGFHNVLPLPL